MKILIAGGGGFIGGHLAKDLISKGHQVICADIKPVEKRSIRTNIGSCCF